MQDLVEEECQRWANKGVNIKYEIRDKPERLQGWRAQGGHETQLRQSLRLRRHLRCRLPARARLPLPHRPLPPPQPRRRPRPSPLEIR
ncbi:hypothetical protein C4D60_Mb06t13940 [Musa balbisiana]|uniref:Uncharacterized protein n=1 Tax=Musa balbisiana TaxID=52838 RepID=A0A4S8IMU4_MUSBA|nr:hypothetical protein C4D60_Mb06t13940 [Musa balbisiana]